MQFGTVSTFSDISRATTAIRDPFKPLYLFSIKRRAFGSRFAIVRPYRASAVSRYEHDTSLDVPILAKI